MEQMVDSSLIVPAVDVPVPLMVEQLAEVLKQFDFQIPEQVIDVPKIYPEDFRTRIFRSSLLDVLTARPPPLVEVQWRFAEQIVETFMPVQVLGAPVPQMGLSWWRCWRRSTW